MPSTPASAPEFQPKDSKGGDQPDGFTPPVARPFLDCIFHWAATVPAAVDPAGQVLCRCRLRIFRNGTLGRAVEWAVLITELAALSDDDREFLRKGRGAIYAPEHNFGLPARACLAEIADQVKAGYLARAPHEQISWFLHDRGQVSRERPLRHDVLQRVTFNVHVTGGKCIYLGFMREPVAPEALELAAGGLVEL